MTISTDDIEHFQLKLNVKTKSQNKSKVQIPVASRATV